jgi:hypothetical protein
VKKVVELGSLRRLRDAVTGGADAIGCLHDVFDVVLSLPNTGTSIPKICPNQLGDFCEGAVLRSEAHIPDDLKEIYEALSGPKPSVKAVLADPEFQGQIPNLAEMKVAEVCREIDHFVRGIIHEKWRNDPCYREPVSLLLGDRWLGREDAEQLFQYCVKERPMIVYQIILGDDKRAVLLKLSPLPIDVLERIADEHL